ncbi:MAG: RHS repeat-associated core domain-containing protein [Bacteroidia bacterium]
MQTTLHKRSTLALSVNKVNHFTKELTSKKSEKNVCMYQVFGDSSLRTFVYKRYRYVGKERDAESGLYYYGARYYAAWTCRFISVDPLAGKYVRQSSYVHADNNPINKIDHNGMGTGDGNKGKSSVNINGGGSAERRDNTQVNVGPNSEMKKTLEAISNGSIKIHDEIKKYNQAIKQSAQMHANETISETPLENPDAQAGRDARKAYDAETNGFVKFSILFNTFAAPVLQAVGSGYQIYKGGAAPAPAQMGVKTEPSAGNKNVTPFITPKNPNAVALDGQKSITLDNGSLGTARTAVKVWLSNVGNLEREQLVKDLEAAGFTRVGLDNPTGMHFERGDIKVRLDQADSKTLFNHMHINYGGNKGTYDVYLNPVNYKSPDAHIQIK